MKQEKNATVKLLKIRGQKTGVSATMIRKKKDMLMILCIYISFFLCIYFSF